MKQLIECVPNFSEGCNMAIIKQITDRIEAVEGVRLLDVDPGKATNRTVVTFVGTPEEVIEAAFQAVKKASELIDMRLSRLRELQWKKQQFMHANLPNVSAMSSAFLFIAMKMLHLQKSAATLQPTGLANMKDYLKNLLIHVGSLILDRLNLTKR